MAQNHARRSVAGQFESGRKELPNSCRGGSALAELVCRAVIQESGSFAYSRQWRWNDLVVLLSGNSSALAVAHDMVKHCGGMEQLNRRITTG